MRLKDLVIASIVFLWTGGLFILQAYDIPHITFIRLSLVLSILAFIMLLSPRAHLKKNDLAVGMYFLFVAIILTLFSIGSEGGAFSALRISVTAGFLFCGYVILNRLRTYIRDRPEKILPSIRNLLIGFLAFLIIIGLIWEGARSGGMGGLRLSGGVNPNTVGLHALGILLFWSWCLFLLKNSNIYDWTLIFLALLVLAWSFSRAAIGAAFVFFIALLLIHFFKKITLLTPKIKKRNASLAIAGLLCILVVSGLTIKYWEIAVESHRVFAYIEQRVSLQEDRNILSRQVAWRHLAPYYENKPLTGGAGWYYSTKILSDAGGLKAASSPHSLYLRLIAEVGIFGAILILLLPIFGITLGVYLSCLRPYSYRNGIWKMDAIATAAIISLFAREFFEDSYTTEYFNFTSSIMLFFIAAIINSIKNKLPRV